MLSWPLGYKPKKTRALVGRVQEVHEAKVIAITALEREVLRMERAKVILAATRENYHQGQINLQDRVVCSANCLERARATTSSSRPTLRSKAMANHKATAALRNKATNHKATRHKATHHKDTHHKDTEVGMVAVTVEGMGNSHLGDQA
jgi:hypothetical protein